MGIYLLPGEEAVFEDGRDWLEWSTQNAEECGFPESWEGPVFFIKCKTPPYCVRDKRPIQCRTFPLMPYLTEDGELQMLYNDNELPYLCPLIEEEIPLNDSFVKATHTAWKHLLRNPGIYDLIWADSEELREVLRENLCIRRSTFSSPSPRETFPVLYIQKTERKTMLFFAGCKNFGLQKSGQRALSQDHPR